MPFNLASSIFVRPAVILSLFFILLIIIANQLNFIPLGKYSNSFINDQQLNKKVIIEGKVVTPPESAHAITSFQLVVVKLNTKQINEKTIVKLNTIFHDINAGDILQLEGVFRLPRTSYNPGEFDYLKYLAYKNIYTIFYAKSYKKVENSHLGYYKTLSYYFRDKILKLIAAEIPDREADILSKMLIGAPSYISEETRESFGNAGIIHVLVVSGANVAYFSIMAIWLLRFTGISFRKAALITVLLIPLYTIGTGSQEPVLRASIMAIYLLLSLSLSREPCIYQSLSLALLTILLLNPLSLFSASMQLSFASTLGIVYFYPISIRLLPSRNYLLRVFGGLFCVSFAAQLAVFPLIAYYFNKISLVGIVSNIFAVPLAGLIMFTGLSLCTAGVLFPSLEIFVHLLAKINILLVQLLNMSAEYFASLKYSSIIVSTPPILYIINYYILVVSVFALINNIKFENLSYSFNYQRLVKSKLMIAGVFVPVLVQILFHIFPLKEPGKSMQITNLSLQNANMVHLSFSDGQNWLINCGRDMSVRYDQFDKTIVPYLGYNRLSSINKIVITGMEQKYYGALEKMSKNYEVDEVIVPKHFVRNTNVNTIRKYIANSKISVREIQRNETYYVSGATITFVMFYDEAVSSTKNSVGCIVLFQGKTIFFTNSLENVRKNICYDKLPQADVLFVLDSKMKNIPYEMAEEEKGKSRYIVSSTNLINAKNTACVDTKMLYSTKRCGAVTVKIKDGKLDIKGFVKPQQAVF